MIDTLCVIQARMGSTRLPGKVLKHIGRWPAIYHTYKRAQSAVPATVVATVANEANAPLIEYLTCQGFSYHAWDGPEDDVLGRFAAVAKVFRPKVIVRLTADCPFLDPDAILFQLDRVAKHDPPFVSNVWPSRILPRGLDVEVVRIDALEAADKYATDPFDREHVMPWLYRTLGGFMPTVPSGIRRWCLDTPEDLEWFRAVATQVDTEPPHPTFSELTTLVECCPELDRREP